MFRSFVMLGAVLILHTKYTPKQLCYKPLSKYSALILSVTKNLPLQNDYLNLCLIGLPFFLIIAVTMWAVHSLLWGIVGFLLSLVLVYLCLGPVSFFSKNNDELIDPLVISTDVFALLFWYWILGWPGLLLYTLTMWIKNNLYFEIDLKFSQVISPLYNVLYWLPGRLNVILLALVGNFSQTFMHFLSEAFNLKVSSEDFIKSAVKLNAENENVTTIFQRTVYALVILALICGISFWLG